MRLNGYESLDNIWMASDFDGAFAEYVTVPASEVFAVDCNWSDAELATIPCAYGTAENMVHRAKVDAGDRVLVPGASGSSPAELVELDGALLFQAFDGTSGRELWKSDGTAAGTQLLADVLPGAESSDPESLRRQPDDHVHLNDAGHRHIVQQMQPAVTQALGGS